LNLLRSRLKSESNKEIFDNTEEKSKKEDMLLLIGTNIVALIIIAGFDRQRIIDENNFQACINYNDLRYILFSIHFTRYNVT